eukprot:GHVR01111638.1.p1 GENE.GHVR01111638.1~~GHVR01111638.1.p1  ORF type:complete len:176 (-),score=46.38 GHVR01111638.1:129-656(-)
MFYTHTHTHTHTDMPLNERIRYLEGCLKTAIERMKLLDQHRRMEGATVEDLRRSLDDKQNYIDSLQSQMAFLKEGHDKRVTMEGLESQRQLDATLEIKRILYERLEETTALCARQQTQLETNASNGCCIACLEHLSCVLLLPCRHLVLCNTCAARVTKCPLCRAFVKQKLCVYTS